MKILKKALQMMLIMMKIGLFTFGGGQAMIALLENEFVSKRKWIESEEFVDLVAIAESTPGPIAINCATYLGYKRAGFWGALLSTVGVCVPSVVIIYVITLFINEFLAIELVSKAFLGMRVAVSLLIVSAGLKMLKKEKKSVATYVLFTASLVFSLVVALTSIDFPSILLILIGGAIGVCVWLVAKSKKSEQTKKESDL